MVADGKCAVVRATSKDEAQYPVGKMLYETGGWIGTCVSLRMASASLSSTIRRRTTMEADGKWSTPATSRRSGAFCVGAVWRGRQRDICHRDARVGGNRSIHSTRRKEESASVQVRGRSRSGHCARRAPLVSRDARSEMVVLPPGDSKEHGFYHG
jgi:hypothetical protein